MKWSSRGRMCITRRATQTRVYGDLSGANGAPRPHTATREQYNPHTRTQTGAHTHKHTQSLGWRGLPAYMCMCVCVCRECVTVYVWLCVRVYVFMCV